MDNELQQLADKLRRHNHDGIETDKIDYNNLKNLPTIPEATVSTDPFSLTKNYFPLIFNGGGTGHTSSGTITYKDGGVHLLTFTTNGSAVSAFSGSAITQGYTKAMKARFFLPTVSCQNSSNFMVLAFSDADNPASASKYVGIVGTGLSPSTFRIDFKTWGNSGVATSTDITASFGTISSIVHRDIMLEFNPGVDAKCYINGVLVATHTTSLPLVSDTTTLVRGLSVYQAADNAGNSMSLELQNAHGYVAL